MSGVLRFILIDQNGNPLAVGSPVAAEAGTGLSLGTLTPATVPNTSSTSGTEHAVSVSFTPSSCGASGTQTTVGSVLLKVTPTGSSEQARPVSVLINN